MINHYQSFFGKKCALIINSNYQKENFYLNFIQEKKTGGWENISEGLIISLKLKEICDISEILERGERDKNIIYNFNNQQKDFWFGFEKKQTDQFFSIKGRTKNLETGEKIRSHQKSFDGGELRLLKKLWHHIENEFIEFTTKVKKDEKIN